jgi:hypothetical protein
MGKKSDLSPECQKFVKKFFAFFSKENVTKKSIVSFDPRSMRVRVSLDFDILIKSFISLCIIETVGAIFREYKPWIVLLIIQ